MPRVARGWVALGAWWRRPAVMLVCPARRRAPMARLGRLAMDRGGSSGSYAGGVLGPGGVACVVELVLDGPVPADAVRDVGGVCLLGREVGDGVDAFEG